MFGIIIASNLKTMSCHSFSQHFWALNFPAISFNLIKQHLECCSGLRLVDTLQIFSVKELKEFPRSFKGEATTLYFHRTGQENKSFHLEISRDLSKNNNFPTRNG